MLSSQLCGDGKLVPRDLQASWRLSISTYYGTRHNQRSPRNRNSGSLARVGRAFGFWRGDHLQRLAFIVRSASTYRWVVLGLSCPSHSAITSDETLLGAGAWRWCGAAVYPHYS